MLPEVVDKVTAESPTVRLSAARELALGRFVKALPSPENAVAFTVPVTSTPVDFVANFSDP